MFAAIDREISGDIALSHCAFKAAKCPHVAGVIQESGELVGGCRRNRHAYDRKEQCKVTAIKLKGQLLTPEVQRIEQHTFNAGFGGPKHDDRLDRVRMIDAAQTKQRAASRVERSCHALEAAFSRGFQAGFRIVVASFQSFDVKRQISVDLGITIGCAATVYG